MKKILPIIFLLSVHCFAEEILGPEEPLPTKQKNFAKESPSNEQKNLSKETTPRKEHNFPEEIAPSKQQILYLAQAQDCKESLALYRKYSQKLGRHDFEVLQQIASIILEQNLRSTRFSLKKRSMHA